MIQSPAVVIQRVMNVVMPLRAPNAGETRNDVKAKLVLALARQRDAITTGLDNLGTIHFARFNVVHDDLHLISVFDGTVQGYIQEFAVQIGEAFDEILRYIADWPPAFCRDDPPGDGTFSVRDHPAEFVEWVMAHDLEQLPRDPTELLRDPLRAAVEIGWTTDRNDRRPALEQLLHTELVRIFAGGQGAHLSMHRGYPGRSVAQIREALEMGW